MYKKKVGCCVFSLSIYFVFAEFMYFFGEEV